MPRLAQPFAPVHRLNLFDCFASGNHIVYGRQQTEIELSQSNTVADIAAAAASTDPIPVHADTMPV